MPQRPEGFDYQRYLASREWSLLREQVRERSGNQCEYCFAAPQQAVHHLTYERIGREELDDLMAICNDCHEFLSGKTQSSRRGGWLVVSPAFEYRFLGREEDKQMRHLVLPYAWPVFRKERSRSFTVVCGKYCTWCRSVDTNWVLFASHLYLDPTVEGPDFDG